MFYSDYHMNPINKLIHFICIPLIVVTSLSMLNYLQQFIFKKWLTNYNLYDTIGMLFLINYLINYSLFDFVLMFFYYNIADFVSFIWMRRSNWLEETIKVFILAWIAQFIGHYIEGNRPALLDSLSTAVTQAPLFSIKYLLGE